MIEQSGGALSLAGAPDSLRSGELCGSKDKFRRALLYHPRTSAAPKSRMGGRERNGLDLGSRSFFLSTRFGCFVIFCQFVSLCVLCFGIE